MNRKKLSIQILALIGLALSIKLAFIYYAANYDKYALSSFCSINEFVDCDGAARTNVAQFLGIPLCYWGIFFYITILFLTLVDFFKRVKCLKFLEVFKAPLGYITSLSTLAFVVSMILAGISLFGIHKLCLLCLITYFVDLVIAIIAAGCNWKNWVQSFVTTGKDFISGVKQYTKTFIILLVTVTTFLCYSGITLNFVPHVKSRHSIMKYRDMKRNPYRVKGNTLGNKDGNVIIELFSDYVCPMCYVHNIMLHQAAKEFKNIKIVHYNYPFDKECNPYINLNMHPHACFMSKAALAAKKQNNYWEMSSLLYENQPTDEEKLVKLLDEAGINKEQFLKDFNSKEIAQELQKDLKKASDMEVNATPTMFINGKQYVGIKPYYKMKEILIENGATK